MDMQRSLALQVVHVCEIADDSLTDERSPQARLTKYDKCGSSKMDCSATDEVKTCQAACCHEVRTVYHKYHHPKAATVLQQSCSDDACLTVADA